MTAAKMIAEARKSLGMSGRPNRITRAYASRNGNAFLRAAWCDMAVTEWARASGNFDAVCFGTDYAYTVWHADRFRDAGRWHVGTVAELNEAEPGDIVFFDWGLSNSIGAIDHVGVVEKVLGGGRIQSIEGNSGDACVRRVRGADVIAGLGRPAYGKEDDVSAKEVWTYPIDTGDGKAPWRAGTVLGHLEKSQDRIEEKLDRLLAEQADVKARLDALESGKS